MIYPHDRIVVVGSDHQLMRFNYRMEECTSKHHVQEPTDVVLEQILLEEGSKLIGETIRSSQIRDKYHCMVIGIERGHSSKMNPESTEDLRLNDIVWLVGEKLKIIELVKNTKESGS
jgi:CPA2 family monovalent cation:H+ antiporter-2